MKDPGHSNKSAGGRLYLNLPALYGNLSKKELARNSSGNIRSQSSQLAEPLWTDPGLKCGISVRELIFT